MGMPFSLASIVCMARRGDADAWRALVARLTPWALGLARRKLPRGLDAEDAVQDAFLTCFRKLDSLRSPDAFPSWFAAILTTHCHRVIASRPAAISLEVLDDSALLPATVPTPEDEAGAAQLLAACDAALAALPPHLRDVNRLHIRHGLSIPEVAAACGLPEGTVKKRLFTARPLLQQQLARFRGDLLFRVGYLPVTDHLLAMCADHLLRGRGLPLLSRRYLSWAVLADDLAHGRLDAAFIMAPLALSLRGAGAPLRYVMDGHHEGSALSLSRQAGRRRVMGLPGAFSTHRVLLAHLGLECSGVSNLPTLVINPSSVITSMQHNEIGAFFCAEPWSAKCLHEGVGYTALRSADILPRHLCCILAVRQAFVDRHGQVVADYVRALLAARDRVRRDPAFGAAVQSAFTGVDAGVARQVLERGAITFNDLEPDAPRMEAFARMAMDAGVLADLAALPGFACPEFLPAPAP